LAELTTVVEDPLGQPKHLPWTDKLSDVGGAPFVLSQEISDHKGLLTDLPSI
jgi:hypothetical protein